jgi:ATP synthase assembly factor FMC1, mitochondrial
MTSKTPQIRSLYRRMLRELPSRVHRPGQSILSNPSPLQRHIRRGFSETSSEHNLHAGEQLVQYLQSQRMYLTLVERYNPGMNMDEEERVRLTARRVGMDLPVEPEDFTKEK